jgi:hypothetical protein
MARALAGAGFPVPSRSPIFLAVQMVHLPAGFVAAASGLAAMLSRKGRGRHSFAGTVYFWSLAIVFGTTMILSSLRWRDDYHLAILGALSFASATMGRLAQTAWPHPRLPLHLVGMGSSYILLLTAFYVDNGKSLPVWRDLPAWSYWILPSAIGGLLIAWTLLRHPMIVAHRSSTRPPVSR